MEIVFEKKGSAWVSEFQVTSDFNLHIEREGNGRFNVYQKGVAEGIIKKGSGGAGGVPINNQEKSLEITENGVTEVTADAGKILIGQSKIGYVFQGELSEFSEEDIIIDDMRIEGKFLIYSNGRIRELYDPSAPYEELKAKYVKRHYSNDDQIAIMLNHGRSEDDNMAFNKMQEWREWSGTLAKKVLTMK